LEAECYQRGGCKFLGQAVRPQTAEEKIRQCSDDKKTYTPGLHPV
jgi:hypothetical protein